MYELELDVADQEVTRLPYPYDVPVGTMFTITLTPNSGQPGAKPITHKVTGVVVSCGLP
jgi:hypothetical protein